MGVTVEVPPRYRRLVNRLATNRNRSFEEHDDFDNDADTWGVDPEHRNAIGLMGELAFAIHTDIQIDTQTVQWTDGGCDFDVVIDGIRHRVDVKTAQKDPYALFVKEQSKPADYYVLAHADGNSVELVGAASRAAVENGQYRDSEYGHKNYVLPISDLEPVPAPDAVNMPDSLVG